jgi:hypothetical protein
MPPIESDKKKLKEADIDIKETLARKLRARHFECLIKYLEDENFKETIKIIIDERNERADSAVKGNRKHTSVVAQVYRLQKELLNLENSKIYQAGKWLLEALSLTGNALVKALLERNLLPKDYHNTVVYDQRDTIQTMDDTAKKAQEQSNQRIRDLQKRIDNLTNILMNKKVSDLKLEKFLKLFQERYGSYELSLLMELLSENDKNN